ncbi:MAG: Orn/Lys/Arg decarboxylase N-terminal domain-containing protein [Candidatus Bipolaricaulota bacterium]
MYTRPKYPVVIVDPTWDEPSFASQRIRAIADTLQQLGYPTHATHDVEDGKALIEANPNLGCLLVAWDPSEPEEVRQLIRAARSHGEYLPVFLLADRTEVRDIDLLIVEQIDEYIWKLEDPAAFVAGRVSSAIEKYANLLLPPFFGAMVRFAEEYEYSWHTPGHCGGTAFLKSAVGQEFVRFFGEQIFRSDLSVSVSELGSLLKHSGPVGKAERNAAMVFGADMTYFVTNGSSTSNRIVFQSCVIGGDSVVIDRNCHKSVEQAIRLSGAIPTYLHPDSNNYGIIGPVPPQRLAWAEVVRRIQSHPLLDPKEPTPVEAELLVLTNSTYDGLCYDVKQILTQIDGGAKRIHFDEAWYAYARFNPLYEDRYAMAIPVDGEAAPTIFATQSTHKLLAALSQASMIHIKSSPRAPVGHDRFNEAYMMHSSTSPQYAIIASNDVAAAMMSGGTGRVLTQESIDEAVAFRQVMARLEHDRKEKRDWWFHVWQPDKVRTPRGLVRFEDADPETLASRSECWHLEPGAAWHGFRDLAPGYCMLDPIKVTLITPGIAPNGSLYDPAATPSPNGRAQACIPAPVVTAFLDSEGIVVEKTGHYTVLFLFSLGITKGKWGTLVSALFEFKHLYDTGAPLSEAIPELVEYYPDRYGGDRTLRDLCLEMHGYLRDEGLCQKERALRLHENQPIQRATARDAYRALVKNEIERVPLDELAGRVVAVGLVPYPPGIPVLMPGEEANDAVCDYLQSLEAFDDRFPGFTHEIHGLGTPSESSADDRPGGHRYWVYCLPRNPAPQKGKRRTRRSTAPRAS